MNIIPAGEYKIIKSTITRLIYVVGFMLAGLISAQSTNANEFQQILSDAKLIMANKNKKVFKRSKSISYILINKTNRKSNFELINKVLANINIGYERSMLNGFIDKNALFENWKAGVLYQQPYNSVIFIGSKANAYELIQYFGLEHSMNWFLKRYDSFQLPCFAIPLTYYSEIKFDIIFIDQNIEDKLLNTCLNEEVIQSFGVFNDATNSNYFSFNDREIEKKITKYDICLLNSLYDNTVKPGDPAKKVLRIFEEKLKGGNC